MPWDETDRKKYAVIRERYATDLSDEEFALIEPLLPPAKRLGRKLTEARVILNALFYLIRAGCAWRRLAKCFPPFTTKQNRFYALPKRWIVERSFGWLNRARRLAKDFETLIERSRAWLLLALAALLVRRVAQDYQQVG